MQGATKIDTAARFATHVSIHAPMQGATFRPSSRPCSNGFNPRPYARGDMRPIKTTTLLLCFNPRPYARGDFSGRISFCVSICFNPRPYARGDQIPKREMRQFLVSIHAPMQGATSSAPDVRSVRRFQSTPLCKGRLDCNSVTGRQVFGFNPRPYARGDIEQLRIWGYMRCFNPRPYARGDLDSRS